MLTVCAWCKQDMDAAPDRAPGTRTTTHGMCSHCAHLFEEFEQQHLDRFLDGIAHPVLCVDDDVRLLHGNRAAACALGKREATMRGMLGGEVTECVHSREPGGCGHTRACTACVIRRSVNHTHETGTPVRDARAFQEVFTPEGVRKQHLRISTEKCGTFVLLHINELVQTA